MMDFRPLSTEVGIVELHQVCFNHTCMTTAVLQPCYKWWEVPFYWLGLKVSSTSADLHRAQTAGLCP